MPLAHLPRRPQCNTSVSSKVTPVRQAGVQAHLCPKLEFQKRTGGSWVHTAGDMDLNLIEFCLDVCPTYLHKTLGADNCFLDPEASPSEWGGTSGVSLQKLRGTPHSSCAPSKETRHCGIPRPCLSVWGRVESHSSWLLSLP